MPGDCMPYQLGVAVVPEQRIRVPFPRRGTEAHALIAVTSDGSTVVENQGDVTTTGENAHGVLAVALGRGTATAPAEVSSLNESGATVTVGGDSANGVSSFIRVTGRRYNQ